MSFGSGSCSAAIELANSGIFAELVCVDVATTQLNEASKLATRPTYKLVLHIYYVKLSPAWKSHPNYYDVVFFHASLHHLHHT
ncbi:MAG: methyltransferase domain-containing protein [Flavobacteriaceae bacterium]